MPSPEEDFINELWDKSFDLYIQVHALGVCADVKDGEPLETAKANHSKRVIKYALLPEDKDMPQRYIDAFHEEFNKRVEQVLQTKDDHVRYQTLPYTQGILEAYNFAIEVDADETEIQEELDYQFEILKFELSKNHRDAIPGSPSRIYSDAYREGLQHILDIIRQKKNI